MAAPCRATCSECADSVVRNNLLVVGSDLVCSLIEHRRRNRGGHGPPRIHKGGTRPP